MSGLSRASFTITNTIRCKAEAPYAREALDHCRQYLDVAVTERKPTLILALGDVPLKELSTTPGSISELRGFVLQSRYGVPTIATYHPAFLARGAMHLLGVFMHDTRRAVQYATHGVPQPLPTNYQLLPTPQDVSNYLELLRAKPKLPAAYDIETEGILGIKEPEALSEKKIIQIQFSSEVGTALVLPWPHEGALEILKTPNLKWDWYGRLFDRKVLRSQGVTINGECHDLMDAWAHCQPNFASAKDDTHGDKGVPSKLMGLQSCLSFYYPCEQIWKGSVSGACPYDDGPEREEWMETQVWPTLRLYGAKDADYTFRLGVKLFDSLKRNGLW